LASSTATGNFGAGYSSRYLVSHRISSRNFSLSEGPAPSSPSAESMITVLASQLSPAKFIRVPGFVLYFLRFQIDGMSVGPSVSSSVDGVREYLVAFISSTRPRPQSGHFARPGL